MISESQKQDLKWRYDHATFKAVFCDELRGATKLARLLASSPTSSAISRSTSKQERIPQPRSTSAVNPKLRPNRLMETTSRSQQSQEWNPTSNSAFTLIDPSCVRWQMARGHSAGFLLASCLALQCFGLASTCLAQPVSRIADYGGSLENAQAVKLDLIGALSNACRRPVWECLSRSHGSELGIWKRPVTSRTGHQRPTFNGTTCSFRI